jgi:poly-gamma-glutamate synthesis protein (capsule biosynthesis protein)
MADKNTVTLMAGGDIDPIFDEPDRLADLVLPVLKQADIRFAQCERTYSTRGWPEFPKSSHGGLTSLRDPNRISIWKTAGIDVISMASNHIMDWGPEALLDTRDIFRGMGMHPVGVGKDAAEARAPVILERNGVKIAFLAYCTVLRPGHQAATGKPGAAPVRAHSSFAVEDWQPGTPARPITTPHEEDLQALEQDIRKVKQHADIIVMSIHWGLHHLLKTICDYQPVVAHAAIDAGADLILGHHPHCLKAVEVYKGKVCFYSIGNFMCNGTHTSASEVATDRSLWGLWWFRMDPDCVPPHGRYLFPTDSRKTMIAKAVFSKQGVEKVSFLPAFINGQAQPEVMPAGSARFREILDFMEWVSDCHAHKFTIEGNEVVVDTRA